MFAQNGEKGLIPGESRIRRFQNIEKFGSDLIQDQCMYGELCPIKCSCSEFPNGKPKRSRRLDDAGVNHLSEQVKNDRIARDLQLIDRDKEFRSPSLYWIVFESSRELERGCRSGACWLKTANPWARRYSQPACSEDPPPTLSQAARSFQGYCS